MSYFTIKQTEVERNDKYCINCAKFNLQTVIELEYTKFRILMKLELCIFRKLFLNFSDSEPQYSHELYSYKNKSL